ncbi:hypothetical protein [Halovivax sp.]|uniref:hypothetical protein n=1 Tax=Halovivax sp. TaxID=1935978 RepID=UPI0025BEDB8D|nr:hypothetical protein [Halovivax sp.]
MVEYYDKILLAIAAVLAAGWLVGALTAVPMRDARTVSFLAATPLVWHALFKNPPLPASEPHRAAVAIVWHALLVWALLIALY